MHVGGHFKNTQDKIFYPVDHKHVKLSKRILYIIYLVLCLTYQIFKCIYIYLNY